MLQVDNYHHSSLDIGNLIISTGLVMPTISQYYPTENNQLDNSNSLPVNFCSNCILFYPLQKWVYSHKAVKLPISLELQITHLTTKLLCPLMTAKLNLTSGWFGIAELTLTPKKVVVPMPWFTQSKRHLNITKVLATNWFKNYWCRGYLDSSTSLFKFLLGAFKESKSINWTIFHRIILLELKYLP